jgi:hypothetical protein
VCKSSDRITHSVPICISGFVTRNILQIATIRPSSDLSHDLITQPVAVNTGIKMVGRGAKDGERGSASLNSGSLAVKPPVGSRGKAPGQRESVLEHTISMFSAVQFC